MEQFSYDNQGRQFNAHVAETTGERFYPIDIAMGGLIFITQDLVRRREAIRNGTETMRIRQNVRSNVKRG